MKYPRWLVFALALLPTALSSQIIHVGIDLLADDSATIDGTEKLILADPSGAGGTTKRATTQSVADLTAWPSDETLWVDDDATGTGTRGDPSDPYPTINAAIADAQDEDLIHVRPGAYAGFTHGVAGEDHYMYFDLGAVVQGGSGMTGTGSLTIGGQGRFDTGVSGARCLTITNAAAIVNIFHVESMRTTTDAIWLVNGTLNIFGMEFISAGQDGVQIDLGTCNAWNSVKMLVGGAAYAGFRVTGGTLNMDGWVNIEGGGGVVISGGTANLSGYLYSEQVGSTMISRTAGSLYLYGLVATTPQTALSGALAGGGGMSIISGSTGTSIYAGAILVTTLDSAGNLALDGTLDLSTATDATLARSGAGDVTVEGNVVYRAGGTDVPVADGGTGASTAQAAINTLTAVAGATNEHVLTKDTGTGDAIFKAVAAGVANPMTADLDTDGNAIRNTTGTPGLQKIVATELQVWDDAEAAGDYVSLYHDGTNCYLTGGSGSLYVGRELIANYDVDIGGDSRYLKFDDNTGGIDVDNESDNASAAEFLFDLADQVDNAAGPWDAQSIRIKAGDVTQAANGGNGGDIILDVGAVAGAGRVGQIQSTGAMRFATITAPTNVENYGFIYCADPGDGNDTMYAMDEDAVAVALASHPVDAPAWMYDETPGLEDFAVVIHWARGTRRWTNNDRVARLAALTDAEKSLLPVEKRTCLHEETFATYNARTGANMVAVNWDVAQAKAQADFDAERARKADHLANWQTRQDELASKAEDVTLSVEDRVQAEKQLDELGAAPEVPKAKDVRKPKPAWLVEAEAK